MTSKISENYADMLINSWFKEINKLFDRLPIGSRIYFLRHGQTNNNLNKIVQGGSIVKEPLNQNGIDQVTQTSNKLSDVEFDKMFSSNTLRSIESARLINKNAFVHIIPNLNEIYWGDIDGKEQGLIYDNINKLWFDDLDLHYNLVNGESIAEFVSRSIESISEIITHCNLQKPTNILISGHGFFIGVLLTLKHYKKLGLEFKPKNGEYIIVEIN